MRALILVIVAGCASDAHNDIASAYCAYVDRCFPQLVEDHCESKTAAMLRMPEETADPGQCATDFDAQSCTAGIGIHIPVSCTPFWLLAP